MKFKIGDKVRIIKNIRGHIERYLIGGIHTITEIKDIDIWLDNKYCCSQCEIELAKVQFTKSDLKDGDIVTYRNGEKRTKIGNKLVNENGTATIWLTSYNEDLTREYKERTETDIIKVERPVKYETVFERKEEILDEAEKRYLRNVIKPFRDKVQIITKEVYNSYHKIFNIVIITSANRIEFPPIKEEKKMYEGMKLNKKYTLEELRTIGE